MSSDINNWEQNERKAIQMAIDKMIAIGAIDYELRARTKHSGYTENDCVQMFESYLTHFRAMCHNATKRVEPKSLDRIVRTISKL